MKRSRQLQLVLLGTAPMLLSGCSQDTPSREGLYTSVASCTAAIHDADTCQKGYEAASHEAAADAPRFGTLAECESNYGVEDCQRQESGNQSFFIPLLGGFMLSQALRNGLPQGAAASAPAFRNRSGQWFRGPAQCPDNMRQDGNGTCRPSGGSHYGGGGHARAPLQPVDMPSDRAVTISRGGFGESGGHAGSGE
ncbi:DUF1190 domain-containing protein [Frateuria aurantia]